MGGSRQAWRRSGGRQGGRADAYTTALTHDTRRAARSVPPLGRAARRPLPLVVRAAQPRLPAVARWFCSIPLTPTRSAARIARPHARSPRDRRAVPGARRRRHRPGSRPRAGRSRHLRGTPGWHAHAPPRLHARGQRSRPRHRRRADDRRLDARDDAGGQGGGRAGRRRRLDCRSRAEAPCGSTCRSSSLLDMSLPTYEPGVVSALRAGAWPIDRSPDPRPSGHVSLQSCNSAMRDRSS